MSVPRPQRADQTGSFTLVQNAAVAATGKNDLALDKPVSTRVLDGFVAVLAWFMGENRKAESRDLDGRVAHPLVLLPRQHGGV